MTGYGVNHFGLDKPDRSLNKNALSSDIIRETSYDLDQIQSQLDSDLCKLTNDQREASDRITDAIDRDRGGIFSLDAPGGTGKTFFINPILAYVRSKQIIIIACASSGIAATLLAGSRTAHSTFKLPLDINRKDEPTCNITRSQSAGRLLMQCKAIVWDECTMAHKKSREALERILRDLRGNNRVMGGLVLILAGDFRQTLPVIPRSTPVDELNACLKSSFLWPQVETLKLSTNMRIAKCNQIGAEQFAETLLSLGNGTFPRFSLPDYITLTPDSCQILETREQLSERVFPDIRNNIREKTWLSKRVILAPRNDMVNDINLSIQSSFGGLSMTHRSADTNVNVEDSVA